jgi:hypothetical protein
MKNKFEVETYVHNSDLNPVFHKFENEEDMENYLDELIMSSTTIGLSINKQVNYKLILGYNTDNDM